MDCLLLREGSYPLPWVLCCPLKSALGRQGPVAGRGLPSCFGGSGNPQKIFLYNSSWSCKHPETPAVPTSLCGGTGPCLMRELQRGSPGIVTQRPESGTLAVPTFIPCPFVFPKPGGSSYIFTLLSCLSLGHLSSEAKDKTKVI